MPTASENITLTSDALQTFATEILEVVNTRIDAKIATTLDSSTTKVPTCKLVTDAVNAAKDTVNLIISDGDITKANVTKTTNKIYTVRKTAADKTFKAYMWINDEIGFAEMTTTTADAASEAVAAPVALTAAQIVEIVTAAANATSGNQQSSAGGGSSASGGTTPGTGPNLGGNTQDAGAGEGTASGDGPSLG